MNFNASDRKDVRRLEKAAKIASREDFEVLFHLMSSTSGRAWVHRRLGPMFHTPFTPDPSATAFNCGIQNEALNLLASILATAPNEFILMMREANDRSNAIAALGQRSRSQNGHGDAEGSAGEDAADNDYSTSHHPGPGDD